MCKSPNDEATMMLCGDEFGHGCGRGFHLGCLRPPLAAVADGAWFCISCQKQPMTGEDTARQDTVVRRRTRSQTQQALQQQNTFEVDGLVRTRTDAEVRCWSLHADVLMRLPDRERMGSRAKSDPVSGMIGGVMDGYDNVYGGRWGGRGGNIRCTFSPLRKVIEQ